VAGRVPADAEDGAAPREAIIGYTTPLIVEPGAVVELRATTRAASYVGSVVRIAGASPDGALALQRTPGFPDEQMLPGRVQPLRAGSAVAIGPSPVFAGLESFTVCCWVLQTLATAEPQALVGTLDETVSAGFRVVADERRGVGLQLALRDGGVADVFVESPVPLECWTFVAASFDGRGGRATISATSSTGETASAASDGLPRHRPNDLLVVGAPPGRGREVAPHGNGCFNGKLSRPLVLSGVASADDLVALRAGEPPPSSLEAACILDFADAIGAQAFTDRSGHRHPVTVLNLPTSGVTGPRWGARTSSFLQAPSEYDAIHFHDDDLEDADWDVDLAVGIPPQTPSGVFALRIETDDCVDLVPFFVTAAGSPARADVAVLLPTLTYLAYANEHEILSNPQSYVDFTGRDPREARFGWRDRYAIDHGLLSLYDVHRDGSTVAYASTLRPLVNVRPDYSWPLIDGPHGLSLDVRLLGWLGRAGFDVDVLTDHDLHDRGVAALSAYRVIVTGGHPEYWTGDMLDGVTAFLGDGGRLMYLGGNGFYWVTGIDCERRHVIEVRRGHANSRPSSSPPGEAWLTTTREEGGIWRHRGRSPNRFLGVGFAAMGGGPGRPYRRRPDGYRAELAFAFEGVEADEIGATGSILGGAAAYEFDRTDSGHGTPADAYVIATASGFQSLYFPTIEDFMASRPEMADPGSERVRADAVLLRCPNGGAVFSAGSAAWCGSLEDPAGATDVGKVTANVLRRFAATPRGTSPLTEPGASA
jgi:N,N-dimethylformamidase